jgi:GT2 family glycosyltransferase
MRPAVDVVIVNFNTGAAIGRCIDSVLRQQGPLRVTVIDNASEDDSFRALQERFGQREDFVLFANPANRGFASAVNRAVEILREGQGGAGPGEYLLILNPDCELEDRALGLLREALEAAPSAGLVAPLVVDHSGAVNRGTLRAFPDPWRSLMTVTGLWRLGRTFPACAGVDRSGEIPPATAPAEAVSGACMLLRTDLFVELGGMDEGYGLHCEDLDLMYRLRQAGHECLIVPAARVYHAQGISSRSRPLWVHWQKHRGMQRFFRKFQAARHAAPIRWLVLAGIWLRFLATVPLALMRR